MLTRMKEGQDCRKLARLALIKERYRKLVLEPRKEIEFELDRDLEEETLEYSRFSSYRRDIA